MGDVLKLASSQRHPQTRACSTCRHRQWALIDSPTCGATGAYCRIERSFKGPCGMDGVLWEPKVRVGLLGHIKRFLVGDSQ